MNKMAKWESTMEKRGCSLENLVNRMGWLGSRKGWLGSRMVMSESTKGWLESRMET